MLKAPRKRQNFQKATLELKAPRKRQNFQKATLEAILISAPMVRMPNIKAVMTLLMTMVSKLTSPMRPMPITAARMTGILMRKLSLIAFSASNPRMRRAETVRPDLLSPGSAENAWTTPNRTASFIPAVVLVPEDLRAYLCTNPVTIRSTPMIAVIVSVVISSWSRLTSRSGAPKAPVNTVEMTRKVMRVLGSEPLLAPRSLAYCVRCCSRYATSFLK